MSYIKMATQGIKPLIICLLVVLLTFGGITYYKVNHAKYLNDWCRTKLIGQSLSTGTNTLRAYSLIFTKASLGGYGFAPSVVFKTENTTINLSAFQIMQSPPTYSFELPLHTNTFFYSDVIIVNLPKDLVDELLRAKNVQITFSAKDGRQSTLTVPDTMLKEWQHKITR